MIRRMAYKLAIELLRKEIQSHAVNANLSKYGCNNPMTLNAIKRREECSKAIEILIGELENNQLEFSLA